MPVGKQFLLLWKNVFLNHNAKIILFFELTKFFHVFFFSFFSLRMFLSILVSGSLKPFVVY